MEYMAQQCKTERCNISGGDHKSIAILSHFSRYVSIFFFSLTGIKTKQNKKVGDASLLLSVTDHEMVNGCWSAMYFAFSLN